MSCGQATEAERRLGKNICNLIRELRPDVDAYFAENQSTVEGLSHHILQALYRAAGFICVMHRRGDIETPDKRTVVRGSVWIEQEIAIVSFMGHVLKRAVPTFFYKDAAVGVEGIRSVLLMNPRVTFTDESQILADLRASLPTAVFNPFSDYDIDPLLTYKPVSFGSGERHTYTITADVKNVGNQKITDFLLHVYFPRAFLDPNVTWGAEDKQYSTPQHICFAIDHTRAPSGLYPGKTLRTPLTFEYFVDNRLFHDATAMRSHIRVELFSGSLRKEQTLNLSDYQQF